MRFSMYPAPTTAGEYYDEPQFDGEGRDLVVGAIMGVILVGEMPGVRVRFPDGNPNHQVEEVLTAVTELLGNSQPPYEVESTVRTKLLVEGGFVDLTIRAQRLAAEAAAQP